MPICDNTEQLIREAASRGARIVLPQEFFATPYFCKEQKAGPFSPSPIRPRDNPVLEANAGPGGGN